MHFAPKTDVELSGERIISTLPFFSYLKIAEGCSNGCTYCAIPMIRGGYRSAPMEALLEEAATLAANGVTELCVIAQDTTRYGEDLYGSPKLPELLTALCRIEGLHWIRVLYCYPERITDDLIEVMAREPKLVKYIDMPIQHCNDEILTAMRRPFTKAELQALIGKLRRRIPGIVLRTTLLTGFPGETEAQFTELAEFAREMRFERLGCFAYSQEEGTKAAKMPGQLDEETKTRRADLLMEQQMQVSDAYLSAQLGKELEAVVEGYDRWAECWFGRTAADAPDIDGKVFFYSKRKLQIGEYVTLRITDTMDYDLIGEVTA